MGATAMGGTMGLIRFPGWAAALLGAAVWASLLLAVSMIVLDGSLHLWTKSETDAKRFRMSAVRWGAYAVGLVVPFVLWLVALAISIAVGGIA